MNIKNPKASILIVTMFLLIITWLIGVIVMVHVRSMLAFTNTFHDYQQAFYMANAGLETELVKSRYHGFGYEDSIESGSNTILENLSPSCLKKCWFSANLKTKSNILWQSEQITNNAIVCDQELSYKTDASKIISSLFLFEDEVSDSTKEWNLVSTKKLIPINSRNVLVHLYGWLLSNWFKLVFQAVGTGWEVSKYDKIIEKYPPIVSPMNLFTELDDPSVVEAFNDSSITQIRVKILNDLKVSWWVCFQSTAWTTKLPWFHQVITSVGSYNNTVVRLQAVQTNIPGDEQDLAGGTV